MNLNGINSNAQLNTVTATPYNGIVWYDSYASDEGRGTNLEPDGGSWHTFKATEMRIRGTYVNADDGNYIKYSLHLRFILSEFGLLFSNSIHTFIASTSSTS